MEIPYFREMNGRMVWLTALFRQARRVGRQSLIIMAKEQDRDREFVEYVIKSIVNNPDAVVVTRTVDEMGVLLSVKVAQEDMGLLIGRSGSTAKAVRTLVRIVGIRNNARVNLRIEGPEGSTRQPRERVLKAKNVDDVLGEIG